VWVEVAVGDRDGCIIAVYHSPSAVWSLAGGGSVHGAWWRYIQVRRVLRWLGVTLVSETLSGSFLLPHPSHGLNWAEMNQVVLWQSKRS
jgi:hypothetical protein